MADNPHAGHRSRFKARADGQNFDLLAPHEQIELLLFYTIPRSDTNLTAHRLLERFGSLSGICAASVEELCAVEGVGPHTASLLRLIPGLTRAYLSAEAAPVARYDTSAKLEDLLIRRYIGVTEEQITLLMFGAKADLLGIDTLGSGTRNAVSTTIRAILDRAIPAHAAYVVLAHNHPGGLAIASVDDLTATRQFTAALELAGVPLLEHYIVAGDRALPILIGENLRGRSIGSFDLRRFYASHTETTASNL